jgi:hypothetical protein
MQVTINDFLLWAIQSAAVFFVRKNDGKSCCSLWDWNKYGKVTLTNESKNLCEFHIDGELIEIPKSRNKIIDVNDGVLYVLKDKRGRKYACSLLFAQDIESSMRNQYATILIH